MSLINKKINKAFLLIGILTATLFVLTSCYHAPTSSEVALAYYNLIIKQDSTMLLSYGMSQETADTVLSNLHQNLKTEINEKLSLKHRITIEPTQVAAVENAYLSALHQLSPQITSQKTEKNYLVKVSTTCIDFNKLDQEAIACALEDVDVSNYIDDTLYLSDLSNAYIKHLIKTYNNALPCDTPQEAEFTFINQKGLWVPEDYTVFFDTLCKLVQYTSTP